jgi:hypothetical protein
VCLTYQVQVKPWFQGIYQRFSSRRDTVMDRKLQLDALGTAVWRMIDGQRTVREIIDAFQTTHRVNRREAELSVSTFLKELGKRGLLAMRAGKNQPFFPSRRRLIACRSLQAAFFISGFRRRKRGWKVGMIATETAGSWR